MPNDSKIAGITLTTCALLSVAAIAHHPTVGPQAPARLLSAMLELASLDRIVHGSVIAIMSASLIALWIFARRRGLERVAVIGGAIAYSLGVAATIGAALIDGFALPDIAAHFARGTAADAQTGLNFLVLASIAVQVLTTFGLPAISLGILAWSIDLLRESRWARNVGFVGIVSTAVALVLVALHASRLEPPQLVLIVLSQAAWYVPIGVLLASDRV